MFNSNKSQIVTSIEGLIAPIAEDQSVEIVQVEYNKGGRAGLIRIYIDKPGGVSLDDCSRFSKEVSGLLDVENLLGGEFTLEVSSPGFKRPLKKAKDFERFQGHKVFVNVSRALPNAPDDNQRKFSGTLIGYEKGVVKVKTAQDVDVEIPEDIIMKANLDD